jgi:hypothetical protein
MMQLQVQVQLSDAVVVFQPLGVNMKNNHYIKEHQSTISVFTISIKKHY